MLIKRAGLLADEAAVGGVGYAAGGVPDRVAQGACGTCVLAAAALGAGRVGKARWCFCVCSVFPIVYRLYRSVYHYFPEVHHAAEGVVEELVVASDEAEPRLHRPSSLQKRRGVAEEVLRER